jgi:hypothetical protein
VLRRGGSAGHLRDRATYDCMWSGMNAYSTLLNRPLYRSVSGMGSTRVAMRTRRHANNNLSNEVEGRRTILRRTQTAVVSARTLREPKSAGSTRNPSSGFSACHADLCSSLPRAP